MRCEKMVQIGRLMVEFLARGSNKNLHRLRSNCYFDLPFDV
jgi:hypothetical protein